MTRIDGRTYKDLRPVEITTGLIKFAEGSCLIRCGDTDGAVLRQRRGAGPAPCAPEGERLGDGGVFHAAPGQPGAQPPGRVQAEALPPQRRDPAAGGPQPCGRRWI